MNRPLFAFPLLTLTLLGGCAVVPVPIRSARPLPDASWLVGSWLPIVPGGDEYPLACQSDAPTSYLPDGRWIAYGDGGRWQLRDERLTLRSTGESAVFPDEERVGDATVVLTRVDADTMRERTSAGAETLYRRCPPPR